MGGRSNRLSVEAQFAQLSFSIIGKPEALGDLASIRLCPLPKD